jgi:hypothetical protein
MNDIGLKRKNLLTNKSFNQKKFRLNNFKILEAEDNENNDSPKEKIKHERKIIKQIKKFISSNELKKDLKCNKTKKIKLKQKIL